MSLKATCVSGSCHTTRRSTAQNMQVRKWLDQQTEPSVPLEAGMEGRCEVVVEGAEVKQGAMAREGHGGEGAGGRR